MAPRSQIRLPAGSRIGSSHADPPVPADGLANMTHSLRVMRLEEVADMAVFVASDRASGMTGTTVNLTMGSLDD